MNAIKKPALALASAALALGAVFASAGPAHADDDHVDLVFVPTCNLSHNFTSGDFFLESHEDGELDPDYEFVFGGEDEFDLGFEVELGPNCDSLTDFQVTLTGATGTGNPSSAGGTTFTWSSSGYGNQGPLTLTSPTYHDDPSPWVVDGDYYLTFTFSQAGHGSVQSSLPLHVSG